MLHINPFEDYMLGINAFSDHTMHVQADAQALHGRIHMVCLLSHRGRASKARSRAHNRGATNPVGVAGQSAGRGDGCACLCRVLAG